MLRWIKNKIKTKIVWGSCLFLLGLIFGYILGYYKVPNQIVDLFKNIQFNFKIPPITFSPTLDFLGDVIALEAVLIAVAIPISLSLASSVKDYDRDVAFFFIKEPWYKWQYWLLIPNIVISIFVKFINNSNVYFLSLLFAWSIFNLFAFCMFIKKVHEYITDTDKVILNNVWNYAKRIFKE